MEEIEDRHTSGTITGGKKAAAANKAKHGSDFYKRIGAIGGRNGHTGGFASMTPCTCKIVRGKHFYQQCGGTKGGRISRLPVKPVEADS